jgi:LacI family transcriptional regulator
MRDVAALSGVSPMTVSRALRGDARVTDATRRRVLAAAGELAYQPNELARNLRLGRTSGLVGLVVTNLANPFYSQLALGVESVAAEHGLKVVLGNTGEDVERERRLVDEFATRQVDGLIVVPAGSDDAHLRPERVGAIPVVLAARPPSTLPLDCVLVDDFNGARDATDRLIEHGARRLGFLGLPPSAWTGSERFRGFSVALEHADLILDESLVRRPQRTIAAAEAAAGEILTAADPPDAIFCANSRNTVGAYRALRILDADVMLAGFDDFELADVLGIGLIVVAYDPSELGRQAARLLVAQLRRGSRNAEPRRVVIPTAVVEYGPSLGGVSGAAAPALLSATRP